MQLSKTVLDALNNQIKGEFESAYLYLSMSAYCESVNFKGFAKWLRKQSQEEQTHGMKIFDYINDRQGRVTLQAIPQPAADFKSLSDIFQRVLKHEQKVTEMINNLYKLAAKENDYATQVALHWFIQEQVEEEKTATEILETVKWIGDDSAALLILDKQMGGE